MNHMELINNHWGSFDDLAPDLDDGRQATQSTSIASVEELKDWLINHLGYTEAHLAALNHKGVSIRDVARIEEDSGYQFNL